MSRILPDELKFGIRTYVDGGRYYRIVAYGEDAARLKRFLAISAPSAGGEYSSSKFDQFVEAAKVDVRPGGERQTEGGNIAADLIISEAGVAVKYNVYLRNDKNLFRFVSTDLGRVELIARLLRLEGVTAEMKKEGGRDVWHIEATTDMLAAGREELRSAIAEAVKKAVEKGWVDASKAERWLKKLEEGRVLKEGWPKYKVRLTRSGSLEVIYRSTNPDSVEREAKRFRNMGLEEGRHFTVKMPEEGREGYVSILKEGLAYAAWLSARGKDEQRLAEDFVKYILRRAEEAGNDVYEKVKKIIEEGMLRGSQTLERFEKKVEVNGKTYVVKVRGGEAVEEDRGGRKLLRIKITAEVGRVEGEHTIVDPVVREYEITYGRYGEDNAAVAYVTARADAPGGRETDAERLAALIKALTGKEPKVYRMKNGKITIKCYREHLEGFMHYAELADAIKKWLEKTE